jgi:AraC-like DNA-binding protein
MPIPYAHVGSLGDPADQAFERYCDSVRTLYDAFPVARPRDDWSMALTLWQVGDLMFSRYRSGAQGVRRAATHLRQSNPAFVRLRLYRRGQSRLVHSERSATLDPGAIHLLDFGREMELLSTESEQIGVFVPYSALGYDPSRHPVHLRIDGDSAAGLVLVNALTSLVERLPEVRQAEAPALAEGFEGLLRGLLSGGLHSQAEGSHRRARAAAMRAHLDRHLHEAEVGFNTLAQAFGASRATIFRDFGPFGGVERYIMNRRLDAAFHELAGQPPRRGAVRQVAERWRFATPAHFSRLFRERFATTPSEIVGLHYRPDPAGPALQPATPRQSDLFGNWLAEIDSR